eukprot:scaffold4510_cov183-Amphora_coffeaeformis.AAC.93
MSSQPVRGIAQITSVPTTKGQYHVDIGAQTCGQGVQGVGWKGYVIIILDLHVAFGFGPYGSFPQGLDKAGMIAEHFGALGLTGIWLNVINICAAGDSFLGGMAEGKLFLIAVAVGFCITTTRRRFPDLQDTRDTFIGHQRLG